MLFKKKRGISAINELGDLLNSFIQLYLKKAVERIRNENTDISNDKLRMEYFSFSVFVVDYALTDLIKDKEIKDSVLDSFYLKIKDYFSDESLKLINLKTDTYAKVIRESKDFAIIIENLGFAFSRELLGEEDLILAMQLSAEFVHLFTGVKELIIESKLI